MHTLYLSEKPSQASDIANVLGIARRHNGYIELKNGDCVTWAVGHLLRLAQPEEMNSAWGGSWKWEQLPMIPQTWPYKTERRTAAQLKVISGLLKTARRVVIATDAGREGELIAREILEHCRYAGAIERFWASALTPEAIKTALANLLPGSSTFPLFEAARARQRADFIHGLTGTRAVTLAARTREAYPLGRVQTPTLALVVQRHLAIKNFKPETYYELEASVKTQAGHSLVLRHAPDPEHRIKERSTAEALMAKAAGAYSALQVTTREEAEKAPLPYALPDLQKDADRMLGMSAKATLKTAQALYEKKMITYPRTDCRYLSRSQIDEMSGLVDSLAKRFPNEVARLKAMGLQIRNTVFDDAKLTDHHGMLPTSQQAQLEGPEQQLHTLVVLRFLEMLSPDCRSDATVVRMDANGVPFKATGKIIKSPGWRSIRKNIA